MSWISPDDVPNTLEHHHVGGNAMSESCIHAVMNQRKGPHDPD